MKNLIIKRSEWLRGKGDEYSYLLRKDNELKCCLGFLALDCGYKKDDILKYQSAKN